MPDDEYAELAADVKANGVMEPITLYEGKILDGAHRYRAAADCYAQCQATEYDGDDPAGFVISRNARRRHIAKLEIAKAVAKCREWAPPGNPNLPNPAILAGLGDVDTEQGDIENPVAHTYTTEELAKEAGVSVRTMGRGKQEVAEKRRIDEETAERIDRCMQASSHQGDDHRREMEQRAQHVQTGEMAPDEFLRIYEEPDSQVATPAPRQPTRPTPPSKKTDKDRIKERDAHIERLQDAVSAMEHQLIEKQTRIEALEQNERILLSQPKGTAGIMDCYNEAASLRAQKATLQSSVAEWMTKYEDKNRLVKSRDKLLKKHGIDVHDPDVWMQTAARNGA